MVCRCNGELVVLIAYAEQIAIACFQGETIGEYGIALAVLDIAECEDVVAALCA